MEGDWTQAIVLLVAIFGVFLWLRNDIRDNRKEMVRLRNDMNQLRNDMKDDMNQLRNDMKDDMNQLRDDLTSDIRRVEGKVDNLDSRLRAVESEQSRVVGLLEGLGLAGALPGRES